MDMRVNIRGWTAALLACAALVTSGCSEEKPKEEIEIEEQQPVDEEGGPRFGLRWGPLREHPAYDAVEHCHELDEVELNLLQYVRGGEDLNADDVAPLFGDEIDPEADEFEKKRQRDAVAAKVSAKLQEMADKQLCLRREIIVEKYDFDAEGFRLPKEAVPVLFDDLTASAEKAVSRVETETMTRRPHGFKLPAFLALAPVPEYLPVPESQAEKILAKLPETKTKQKDEESADGSRNLERFGSVLSRMEPEVIEAAVHAEDHVPEGKSDRPVGEFFTNLQEEIREATAGRKANAVLLFEPVQFSTDEFSEQEVDIPLRFAAARLTHLVATTPDGQVFSIVPEYSGEVAKQYGERVDVDREKHDPLLEKVCRGGVRTHVDTQLRDGELVDIETPRCRRCPAGASERWGRAPLEEILFGSFTHPGAIEAVVRTTGCEPLSNGGGGITLLEKLADGSWRRAQYTAGQFGDAQIVRTPSGRDVLVSRSEAANAGYATGSVYATWLDEDEHDRQSLFPIYDNAGSCDEDYLIVEPEDTTRADINNDGVLDLTFEVGFRKGIRSGRRCDFGENMGIADGETLELSYVVADGEFELADQSKDAHAKIENAVEGAR